MSERHLAKGWLVDGGDRNQMLYKVGNVEYPMTRVGDEEFARLREADPQRRGIPTHFRQLGDEGGFQVWPGPSGDGGGSFVRYHFRDGDAA